MKKESDKIRFLRYIRKTKKCWIWTGGKTKFGYGKFGSDGRIQVLAHRFSYQYFKGEIPDNLFVLHCCDNPPCVNPEHLRTGTPYDNIRDREDRRRGGDHRGEKHGRSKITLSESRGIKKMYASKKYYQKELADIFSVGQSTISSIIRKKTWNY